MNKNQRELLKGAVFFLAGIVIGMAFIMYTEFKYSTGIGILTILGGIGVSLKEFIKFMNALGDSLEETSKNLFGSSRQENKQVTQGQNIHSGDHSQIRVINTIRHEPNPKKKKLRKLKR